jgi:tetraacyldisaccharide 4'-kinase
MNDSSGQNLRRIMDGSDRSAGAGILRFTLAVAEPFYAGAMRLRNFCYDNGILKTHSLGRPAISVGNITTGGTGKTPVVQWMAERLAEKGQRPAILIRGYKSTRQGISDETAILSDGLRNTPGGGIPVIPEPNRIRGAAAALRLNPQTSVFILDDGMQHRRAKRDFNLVLIHAAEPFGFSHVLPRGMLREPTIGLRRASAFLITHAGEVSEGEMIRIEAVLRQHNIAAPIFRADHVIDGFLSATDELQSENFLSGKKYFAFCGIGLPYGFLNQSGGTRVGAAFFDDHHDYTAADLVNIIQSAQTAGAQLLVTTEKDGVKLSALPNLGDLLIPIYRARLTLRFWPDHEERLLKEIQGALFGGVTPGDAGAAGG